MCPILTPKVERNIGVPAAPGRSTSGVAAGRGWTEPLEKSEIQTSGWVASPYHVPTGPNLGVTSVYWDSFVRFNRLVESITCRKHLTAAGTLVTRTFILRAVS